MRHRQSVMAVGQPCRKKAVPYVGDQSHRSRHIQMDVSPRKLSGEVESAEDWRTTRYSVVDTPTPWVDHSCLTRIVPAPTGGYVHGVIPHVSRYTGSRRAWARWRQGLSYTTGAAPIRGRTSGCAGGQRRSNARYPFFTRRDTNRIHLFHLYRRQKGKIRGPFRHLQALFADSHLHSTKRLFHSCIAMSALVSRARSG